MANHSMRHIIIWIGDNLCAAVLIISRNSAVKRYFLLPAREIQYTNALHDRKYIYICACW